MNPDGTPPLRIMAWAHARSRSTAFSLAVASLPEVKAFHELYAMAYYNGEERPIHLEHARPLRGYRYAQVKDRLEGVYPGKNVVFCKDMAYCLDGNFERLPVDFKHTFIIRDPRRSITSLWQACLKAGMPYEPWIPEGGGLKHLYELFRHATGVLRQPPVVLDSDELANHPEDILKQWCPSVGLEFRTDMLRWEAGNISHWEDNYITQLEDNYSDSNLAKAFFGQAVKSTGFQPTVDAQVDWEHAPGFVKDRIKEAIPYYEAMHEKRIRATISL